MRIYIVIAKVDWIIWNCMTIKNLTEMTVTDFWFIVNTENDK